MFKWIKSLFIKEPTYQDLILLAFKEPLPKKRPTVKKASTRTVPAKKTTSTKKPATKKATKK